MGKERAVRRGATIAAREHAVRHVGHRYLEALVEIGVLGEEQMDRDKLFAHPKRMALLTRVGNDFALFG